MIDEYGYMDSIWIDEYMDGDMGGWNGWMDRWVNRWLGGVYGLVDE